MTRVVCTRDEKLIFYLQNMARLLSRSPVLASVDIESLLDDLENVVKPVLAPQIDLNSNVEDDDPIETEFQKFCANQNVSNQLGFAVDGLSTLNPLVETSTMGKNAAKINESDQILPQKYEENSSQLSEEKNKTYSHNEDQLNDENHIPDDQHSAIEFTLINEVKNTLANKLEYTMSLELNDGHAQIENHVDIDSKSLSDQFNNAKLSFEVVISEQSQRIGDKLVTDHSDSYQLDAVSSENREDNKHIHIHIPPEPTKLFRNTLSSNSALGAKDSNENVAKNLENEEIQRPRLASILYAVIEKDFRGTAPYDRYKDFANADITNYEIGEMVTHGEESKKPEIRLNGCTPYLDIDYSGMGQSFTNFAQEKADVPIAPVSEASVHNVVLHTNGADLLAEIFIENLKLLPSAEGGQTIGLVPEIDPKNPNMATLKLNVTLTTTPKLIYETVCPFLTEVLGIPEVDFSDGQFQDLPGIIGHLAALLSSAKVQLHTQSRDKAAKFPVKGEEPSVTHQDAKPPQLHFVSTDSQHEPKTSSVSNGFRKLLCLPFLQKFRS